MGTNFFACDFEQAKNRIPSKIVHQSISEALKNCFLMVAKIFKILVKIPFCTQGIVDYTRLGIALANLIILGSSSSFLLLFNVNERPSSLLPQSLPDLEIITEWLLD